ncbi:unnamed protein product [Acanthosepion pharaonis]|uniref:Uncharacterized protein n=1 Tax=Acanthosepion pharaonis TaxID=158019 RepID=A0A812EB39_ACAPH|nr:unnamed protein product [Sepia pharaonis]
MIFFSECIFPFFLSFLLYHYLSLFISHLSLISFLFISPVFIVNIFPFFSPLSSVSVSFSFFSSLSSRSIYLPPFVSPLSLISVFFSFYFTSLFNISIFLFSSHLFLQCQYLSLFLLSLFNINRSSSFAPSSIQFCLSFLSFHFSPSKCLSFLPLQFSVCKRTIKELQCRKEDKKKTAAAADILQTTLRIYNALTFSNETTV